ncbi:hypothetical protein [Streptomyces zingiberis]|uniref:Secreted protein n=1 Tax=Streptomyces zingiberis TaxID=2053010 RepID=A0ABX1C1N1_9ACTN|nr:hypothetical protein [Streptomyces zingiberis]NJQ02493.1 hypothetical protein [Streptomyces zingiberis]
MRRGLLHTGAWLLATGAATTLSWWGVHTALTGTAYDRPRALPLVEAADGDGASDAGAADGDDADESSGPDGPGAGAESSPPPSPSPTGRKTEPSAKPSPEGRAENGGRTPQPPRSEGQAAPPSADGDIKSYPVTGGRVVLDLREHSASLVSATPDAGWQMQVWEQSEWIRVDFTAGTRTTSVFCTWNGHPPQVQVVDG